MSTPGDRWEPYRENAQRSVQPIRVTYVIGKMARRAVEAVQAPYRFLAEKLGQASLKKAGRSKNKTHQIGVRLSQMTSRLQEMEESLQRNLGTEAVEQAMETDRQISQVLGEAMTNPDPAVRAVALGTIGTFVNEDITLLILDAFHDPEPTVRRAAVQAAAKAGISSAVFSLIFLLSDRDSNVCQEAWMAIEQITGKKVNYNPRDDEQTRQQKIEKIKSWWKEERFTRLKQEVNVSLKS